MRKSIFISLLGLAAMFITSCQPDVITATGLTITPDSKTIAVGETVTLNVTVLPENAENKDYQLTIDNTDIATLEGNVLTAVAEGTATVTATLGDLKATAVFTVEIPVIPVTAMEITLSANEVEVGKTVTAAVKVMPDNATNKEYTLSVNDTDIATVSGNEITGVSVGEVTVFAKIGDVMASATLIVKEAKLEDDAETTGIEIDPKSSEITVGQTISFNVSVLPVNAMDKSYTLTVDNPELAKIDGNLLTALAPGTVTVTAAQGEFSAQATITIIDTDFTEVACTGCNYSNPGQNRHSFELTSSLHTLYITMTEENFEGTHSYTYDDTDSYAAIYGDTYSYYSDDFTITITKLENGNYSIDAMITFVDPYTSPLEEKGTYHYTFNGSISGL